MNESALSIAGLSLDGETAHVPGIPRASMPRFATHSARRRSAARTTVRKRPDAILWALALMHVTYVWRLPSIVSALQPLRLGLTSGGIAVGLFLLDRSPRRRLIDVPIGPVKFTVVLLGLMVMSVFAGIYPRNSGQFLVDTTVPTMLLMLMVAASLRSLADVEWFAMINMIAAAGYCLFVLWAFRVGANGRLAELIYYDTNDLALLIVSTLPLVGYFMTRGHTLRRRVQAGLCFVLFLFLLILSGSRGAFVGLVVITSYLATSYRGFSRAARLGGVMFVALVFTVLGGATYFSKIETLLNPTQDYNWNGKSQTGRLEIWKRGLGYLSERPLFGVGVHNFDRAEGTMSAVARDLESRGRGFKWSVAHNSYLETAVEAGPGALVCFLGMFGATFHLLRRVIRAMRRLPYVSRELVLAQALTASLMGYLVCAFFISAEYFVYPFVLVGLSMGLTKVALPSRTVA